jgi:hypothetical protein
MLNFKFEITDFNLDNISSDEKSRFYKIFQILDDIWNKVYNHIDASTNVKKLSTINPSIHNRGYHTVNHTYFVVNKCYDLGLKMHLLKPLDYTAIDVLVLLISAMLHDYVQDGDINLVTKKYKIKENGKIITKSTKIPVFKRETGNNEFASANVGVELMKNYNKEFGITIFKPENINALLNLIQATEPDFGRVLVLEGEKLTEYMTVIQPKLITPVVITRWIICACDLGTVSFAPENLIQDAYRLIREEIWESNLIKIFNGDLDPIKSPLSYEETCIISSLICGFIDFQSSFVKAQRQRVKNYLEMFDTQSYNTLLPFFGNEKLEQELGNFELSLTAVNKEIEYINKLHTEILDSKYSSFISLLQRAKYI